MTQRIFISYADRDVPGLDHVKKELRERGIVHDEDEFIDPAHTALPGDNFRGVLRKAIESASMVVLVWDHAASRSAHVNYEAGMADALDKRIVVVVPEGETSRPRVATDVQVVELASEAA